MILGVGTDLCRVVRIRLSVERLGETWIAGIFTDEERERCQAAPDPGLAFARGFAVKEAVSKALGTGFAEGLDPRQVIWREDESSVSVILRELALKRLVAMTPHVHAAEVRVTLGGTQSLISCLAVIETIRANNDEQHADHS